MNMLWFLVNLLFFTQFVACRDFYLGMFRRNDFLVAQDVLYKAPAPFGFTTASYGRLFKCPITYFRVVDRLGQGRGPFTTIVRGGLRKSFISVRIKSTYRLPVSVNIYVGCENNQPSTFRSMKRTSMLSTIPMSTNAVESGTDSSKGIPSTFSSIKPTSILSTIPMSTDAVENGTESSKGIPSTFSCIKPTSILSTIPMSTNAVKDSADSSNGTIITDSSETATTSNATTPSTVTDSGTGKEIATNITTGVNTTVTKIVTIAEND